MRVTLTYSFCVLFLFAVLIFLAKHSYVFVVESQMKITNKLTSQQALDLVDNLPEVTAFKNLFTDDGKGPLTGGVPVVEIQEEDQDSYIVEVYEYIDGKRDGWERAPRQGTYFVNKKTGEVKEISETPFEILVADGLLHDSAKFPATPTNKCAYKICNFLLQK